MRWILMVTLGVALVAAIGFSVGPGRLEQSLNQVLDHEPYAISAEAGALHADLVVGDLHTDSTLWARDLTQRADRGHVDLPRLRDANVALQAFTFVTRSPKGQNYESNDAEARDNITLVALIQRWPMATWSSLTERALLQAQKLAKIEANDPQSLRILRDRDDLEAVMEARAKGVPMIGALLGIEGSHALDDSLSNIDRLRDAGVRMFGLHHFFDNALGGSLHGTGGGGLSPFGREVVQRLDERGAIIDVAHSSQQSVRDVLAMSDSPLVVSHTGFQGYCPTPRNISDDLMQQIAAGGGLIGVGYWDAAVCKVSPAGIVGAIRYGIDLVGVDHVALGSDYDGSTTVPFDTSELAALTQEMLNQNFSEDEIRKVMGGNMLSFLQKALPGSGG
ncbi:membrane dipeptidase [Congregibacter variabilis]|uniref:Membrane dipeptidase n=1 Tax=Congregibacter variabilis TaxID=3081200 RepID=A0ABZ0I4U2_9GAMM|nr:membrane dipeptidase [Congregibacter sp. IMCC43200]